MPTDPPTGLPDLRGLSNRKVGRIIIESVMAGLDMSATELASLTGYAPSTVLRYRAGAGVPSRVFILDLLEKAPNAGLTYDKVAVALGRAWNGALDPTRYRRRFDVFASAVRVVARRDREQFAVKLGVSVQTVSDVERGVIPEPSLVRRLTRQFLPRTCSVEVLESAFPVLRPSIRNVELRERILKIRALDAHRPSRRSLEEELIEELVPTAQMIARKAAWSVRTPELYEEIWGEGLMLAVRFHDPARGYFLSYLKARICGLARNIKWSTMQSGVSCALRDHGLAVREALDRLPHVLGREPTDAEISEYLDVPDRVVAKVRQALQDSHSLCTDNLEFFLRDANEVRSFTEASIVEEDSMAARLRALPDGLRELLFLHYFDQMPVRAVAAAMDMSEEEADVKLRWAVAQLGA